MHEMEAPKIIEMGTHITKHLTKILTIIAKLIEH